MRKQSLLTCRCCTIIVICCCAFLLLNCKSSGPDEAMLKADMDNLKQTDTDWSSNANNIESFMTYVLDDAHMLPPNDPLTTGKEDIKAMFSSMMELPGFSLKWEPSVVEIASSGDLGYTIGAYKLSINDSTGMPMVDTGKYLTVWKKQANGSWKVTADMFNSDLPMH